MHFWLKKEERLVLVTMVAIIGVLAIAYLIVTFSTRRDSIEASANMRLRSIASAGQQYILEENVSHVRYSQLVGDYILPISPVRDETYDHVIIDENGGTITVEIDSHEYDYTY